MTARREESPSVRFRTVWLFGPALDFYAFVAPALLALLLLWVGHLMGVESAPPWVFFLCVVAVDVAHVHATLFRVYLDPAERKRRPFAYFATPLGAYLAGVAIHQSSGSIGFWRTLAYLAVWHFIRQQVGWLRLYRARGKDHLRPLARFDNVLDHATIYVATLFPVLHWHAHLPKNFHWFAKGDFVAGLAPQWVAWLAPLYLATFALFIGRQVHLAISKQGVNLGKFMLVTTTYLLWFVGIVAMNNDYAFTVTNVLPHGVPYFVLIAVYSSRRYRDESAPKAPFATTLVKAGWPVAYAFLIVLAMFEEGFFDRLVWHDHEAYFGEGHVLSASALAWLVPLLALPQTTHYVLDGMIWSRKQNPDLAKYLA